MMRHLAILTAAAVCLAARTSAKAVDEADVAKAQKVIFKLAFSRFEVDKVDPEMYKKGQEWDFEAQMDSYDPKYQVVVKEFLARYKLGMLPRGQLFSIYYPHLVDDTVQIFKLFYHAPDLWTFIYTAVWASIYLNEHQFIYALSSALVQRLDTKFIPLPRPYQVYPEYFFNTDVMKQVYDYKMSLSKIGNLPDDKIQETETHVVVANYTNWYTDTLDHEHNLTYFTEDISANAWYYYFNHRYPFWMSSAEYPDLPIGPRGEIYYYLYRSLLNRYNLERLSHGLGEVELMNWDHPIIIGYSPCMTYPNGLHFPGRPEWSKVPAWKNEQLENIKEFDSRITQVIDSGYMMMTDGKFKSIRNEQGLDIIGNLIQGNHDSPNKNYFGSIDILGRQVLGFSPKPQNNEHILPSALEQTLTSMRDPGFYSFYKKINSYFLRYKKHLSPYTPNEVAFEGVTIDSANIVEKDLFTYFEQFYPLIERFWYSNNQRVANIKARQYRLNHKPFTFNISVNSLEDVRASIRIFMGPKYNVHGKEISDNYNNFWEIDYFVKDLTKGTNIIERNSTDSPWCTFGCKVGETFEKYPEDVEQLHLEKCRFGFPGHLLLPRGKREGFHVLFFMYVSKFTAAPGQKQEPILGSRDNKPLGFPLDRPIHNFNFSNMYFMDTLIYHKNYTHEA